MAAKRSSLKTQRILGCNSAVRIATLNGVHISSAGGTAHQQMRTTMRFVLGGSGRRHVHELEKQELEASKV